MDSIRHEDEKYLIDLIRKQINIAFAELGKQAVMTNRSIEDIIIFATEKVGDNGENINKDAPSPG